MSDRELPIVLVLLVLFGIFICWMGVDRIDWFHAMLTTASMSAFSFYRRSSRRLALAKKLPIGEITLAVRGDEGMPFIAFYDGRPNVAWDSDDVVSYDFWEELGYRSSDQEITLELIVYTREGLPHSVMIGVHEIIRHDNVIGGLIGKGKMPESLNFRLLVDISQDRVRLIAFPGFSPSPYDDPPDENAPWRKGGTTIWIGMRKKDGSWGRDSD